MEYRRDEWGPGPWQDEPDRVEFEHAGLPCLILRNEMGNWCGYAAVPPGHPAHGKDYDDDAVDVLVHGGLTYANKCGNEICHVPKPGEPDDVWWFGFDCAHAGDIVPQLAHRYGLGPYAGEAYRDVEYIKTATQGLAEQLAAMAGRA